MSLRRTSSSLCNVALDTVTPPTWTGSSSASGLSTPVLPTRTWISRSFVTADVGAHLYARAKRGRPCSEPSRRCCSNESTLTTIPSIS